MTKDDLKVYFNKGVEASKEALDKAGKAVSKFSDESILKIEIQQLKSQIKKEKASLGDIAYQIFVEENQNSLEKSNEAVAKILENIAKTSADIDERQKKLKGEESN